jgi:FMN phosphatase YigB (HAD superfamily)
MIKGVFFDAAGVFYDRKESDIAYVESLLKQSGYPTEISAEARVGLKELRNQATEGRISHVDYWDQFLQRYGVNMPEKRKVMVAGILEHAHQIFVFPGGREALAGLKERGFVLGIITDTMWPSEWKKRWLGVAGVNEFFDVFISSAELGAHKPEPVMYLSAIRQANLTPSECAFVGHDAPELDGARQAAMATVAVNYDPDAKADYYCQSLLDLLTVPIFQKKEERRK